MSNPEEFTDVPGIAALAPLETGDPANLPDAVPGLDKTRNRIHVGGSDKPREISLRPDKEVALDADPVVELLPENPVLNQIYGIKFKGMASQHDISIDSNGTPFNVLKDDGQTYESLCKWDLPLRNSEAWFQCVMGLDGQLKWEHY